MKVQDVSKLTVSNQTREVVQKLPFSYENTIVVQQRPISDSEIELQYSLKSYQNGDNTKHTLLSLSFPMEQKELFLQARDEAIAMNIIDTFYSLNRYYLQLSISTTQPLSDWLDSFNSQEHSIRLIPENKSEKYSFDDFREACLQFVTS